MPEARCGEIGQRQGEPSFDGRPQSALAVVPGQHAAGSGDLEPDVVGVHAFGLLQLARVGPGALIP